MTGRFPTPGFKPPRLQNQIVWQENNANTVIYEHRHFYVQTFQKSQNYHRVSSQCEYMSNSLRPTCMQIDTKQVDNDVNHVYMVKPASG